jgi:Luciferase
VTERPKLVKVDVEMRRWCAQLEEEVSSWPRVTSRPMFGMLALYRGKQIFAALPRTRAAETPFSLMLRLPDVRHDRLTSGSGPGGKWVTFAMESEADIPEALAWLGRAFERAK